MTGKRTQQKQITNLAKAWRYLAEQVATRKSDPMFLCLILSAALRGETYGPVDARMIDASLLERMHARVRAELGTIRALESYRLWTETTDHPFFDGTFGYRDANPARGLFCLLCALEAEDSETKWSAA